MLFTLITTLLQALYSDWFQINCRMIRKTKHLHKCTSQEYIAEISLCVPLQYKGTINYNSYSIANKMHLFLKLFILVKRSACFGRSFRPSSGAQNCTYGNRRMSNTCC